MTQFTAVIVDPSQLFREGLKKLLRSSKFAVLDTVKRLDDLKIELAFGTPHVIVYGYDQDLRLEEQFEYLSKARKQSPQTRIILLTHFTDLNLLVTAAAVGVDAVLSRDISGAVLQRSLELVMLGQQVFPASAQTRQLDLRTHYAIPFFDRAKPPETLESAMNIGPAPQVLDKSSVPLAMGTIKCASAQLSHREDQILRLLVAGASNKLIARDLGITEGTVKVHVKSLCRKLGATNRTQAAVWGQRQ